MDANVLKLIGIVEKRLGVRFVRQLFCVLLILFGVEKIRIIEGLGVSRFSIKKYNELIDGGNIEKIFEDNTYRQKSELEGHKTEILAELEKTPPQTLREAAVLIERVCGIKRSIPQVWNFLKKTGIKL
jgi:transposase